MVEAVSRSQGQVLVYDSTFMVCNYEVVMMAVDTTNHDGIIGESPAGRLVLSADSLTGERVVNEAGEHIGEIKHIMLDVRAGTIAYCVLAFGGFLGVGDKLFAVPWHAFAVDVDNKWFVLNIDKDRMRDAPGFDKDHWPTMADPTWSAEVHAYYGPVASARRPFI